MNKKIFYFLIISLQFLFISCYGSWNIFYEGNDVNNRTKKILYITDSSDSHFAASGISSVTGKYNVLVISDLHFGAMRNSEPIGDAMFSWLEKVRGTEEFPKFALSLGDVADVGKQSDYDKYLDFCKKLDSDYGIKMIFNVCGNHDIYESHWDNWEKNCYPYTSFYKFQTAGFSFYALDTASGVIGQQQYDILKKEMNCDPNPKIVFSHYPLTSFNPSGGGLCDTLERNLLINDFYVNNVKCYLGGHNHNPKNADLGFYDYCVPSLRYNKAWFVLHIDETSSTVSGEIYE